MDPLTALLIATLMMLLNGGMLGLVHRELPPSLRPSAISWRVGTLLQASGCVLLAVNREFPPGIVLPLANGMLMLGLTGYWRALRQFDGRPETPWLLAPLLIGSLGVAWYAGVSPNFTARVIWASLAWASILVGCALTLGTTDRAISRRVLAMIFVGVALFMIARMLHFAGRSDPATNLLDNSDWMSLATPIIAAVMPVIGTTAFLLMCSERIRRDWEHAASTDYLTGLANRRTMAALGSEYLTRALRDRSGFAAAVVDIDHFKSINDRFGHDIGDAALKHVAACIEAACSPPDRVGRQGGEEFVALLVGVDAPQAMAAAERMRLAVQTMSFQPDPMTTVTLTVSIGVAVVRPDDTQFDDLLRRADQALYAAKANGRNRVEMAAPGSMPDLARSIP